MSEDMVSWSLIINNELFGKTGHDLFDCTSRILSEGTEENNKISHAV
jgi:hypothetical protein